MLFSYVMIRYKVTFIVIIVFFSFYHSVSSTSNAYDKLHFSPEIKSFSKLEYGAENQNWDIDISDKGVIYFANSLGLLRFDGEDWNLLKTDDMLRAVNCQNDTIYVGGERIMGYYLESDLESGLHILSLINNSIWKIFPFKNRKLFQGFNTIYYLDDQQRIEISKVKDGNMTYAYADQSSIYYQVSYGSLRT
jgi:hypothetical protein